MWPFQYDSIIGNTHEGVFLGQKEDRSQLQMCDPTQLFNSLTVTIKYGRTTLVITDSLKPLEYPTDVIPKGERVTRVQNEGSQTGFRCKTQVM